MYILIAFYVLMKTLTKLYICRNGSREREREREKNRKKVKMSARIWEVLVYRHVLKID